ncbi:hypothetical protein [Dyella sedimenti]|uniref:hypothetical protein n=1 Tax=Dyella sedimenti TaxID=2919947 RepID=UPI001FAAE389|nr:hypothetical protein [Dyella sedimenti]
MRFQPICATIILVVSSVTVAGCATSSKTYGPDGREAYTIGCSGAALDWGLCYKKAGDICGSAGYDVVSKNGEQGAVAGGGNGSFFGGTTASRSLVVECKKP